MHQLNPELFREQAQKMKRVVICCDHEAPAEMLRDALTVGRALTEWGHSIAYIVGDPATLVESAGPWTINDIYQAPVRRAAPDLVMKSPAIDGFADLMAVAGFEDKATLVTLGSLWNRQLLALKPDAIIGFYSPLLWLIGPMHAPTFALGSGLMLPPAIGTSFPRLSPDSTPLADEAVMLDNANTALQRNGQPGLTALSGILERCTSFLYGVPAFDPYLQIRRQLSNGLLGEEPTPTMPPPKERLALFLDVYCPNIEQIVLSVASLHYIPIDICISGATGGMRRFLEQQPHVRLFRNYTALFAEAPSATALVHHGVHDVGQRALSLGRPQLIIPWTREQQIFSETVKWMGFSWTKESTTPIEEMASTLLDLAGGGAVGAPTNQKLTVAAQHHARQLAKTMLPDATSKIVDLIEKSSLLRPGTASLQPAILLNNREAESQNT
jgi:hypothetical protein